MTLLNICRNIRKGTYFPEMSRKVLARIREPRSWREKERRIAAQWCRQVAEDGEAFALSLDPALWAESLEFGERLRQEAEEKAASGLDLVGGGHYRLLYFLTRFCRPEVIVETGVAAGYSSRAFLEALRLNRRGKLYSSDFPYFREKDPERQIGVLVPEELRAGWELYLEGDARNLKKILARISRIDLFHYDSDKTYTGRAFAMNCVAPFFRPSTVVIMDDVGDNTFFRSLAEKGPRPGCVFEFEGKYLGVIQ